MSQKKSYPVSMRVKNAETGQMETKQVGTAEYLEFDAVGEAVENMGEEAVLALINAQVKTNEMNRVRGLVRGGPSKKLLEAKVMNSLTLEDIQGVIGDPDGLRKLIDERVERLRAEEIAKVGVGASEDE